MTNDPIGWSPGQSQSEKPQLAIVDDEADFRLAVRLVAEPLGWAVEEYADGHELVVALGQSGAPDLILLDMVMPELDGIETIGWIAATSFRCPIALVSGQLPTYLEVGASLGRERGLEIVAALRKPIRMASLTELLDAERVRAIGGRDGPSAD